MGTYTDKLNRIIEIGIEDLDVIAIHDDVEVGRLRFDEIDCDNCCSYIKIVDMRVDKEYQKSGIGVEMMRTAVEIHGDFSRAPLSAVGGSRIAAEEYYTDEGAALIWRCIALGILEPDQEEHQDNDNEENWS